VKSDRKSYPSLTIVICCYNGELFVEECLNSLINQRKNTQPFNVLFIDDGSSDQTLSILQKYKEKLLNLKVLINKVNLGVVRSCNLALQNINTKYFMRLDVDDYLANDAVINIENELSSFEAVDFIVFNRWDILQNGNSVKKIQINQDFYNWTASGVVFKTGAVKTVKGYSDEFWEEIDLFIKLLEAGYKYKISPYFIYCYRRGHASRTKVVDDNQKGLESLIKKWGHETLQKYGRVSNLLGYYQYDIK